MPDVDEQANLTLLMESLETGIDYLPRLISGMNEVVRLLRQGRRGEANGLLTEALEGIEWLLTVIETVHVLPLKADESEGCTEKLEHFRGIMKNLLVAYSAQDLVLTGDIIEYELVENLEYWLKAFGRLINSLKPECTV